jgi:hypothetical protein
MTDTRMFHNPYYVRLVCVAGWVSGPLLGVLESVQKGSSSWHRTQSAEVFEAFVESKYGMLETRADHNSEHRRHLVDLTHAECGR